MHSESIRIKSLTELELFAQKFAGQILQNIINTGLILGLEGDLGAGKTTFVRFLVAALGSQDKVSSPSYVLENIYQAEQDIIIKHWDLFRLSSDLMPEELYEGTAAKQLIIIEWPERSQEITKSLQVLIKFELTEEDQRVLSISTGSVHAG